MAAVTALVPDLLFGSKVKEMLERAGHEVDIVSGETEVWDEIAGTEVLVIDLASEDVDGIGLIDTLKTGGEANHVKTLGFYSHVEADTKRRAEQAGFDLVVPRSRMAREGADLVARLAAA